MNYVPEFRRYWNKYLEEKETIQTKADWLNFKNKWFNSAEWPKRISSYDKTTAIQGRVWIYYSPAYSLMPEDYYEYRSVSRMMEEKYLSEYFKCFKPVGNDTDGWYQDCPFCLIISYSIGGEVCPKCGRHLLFGYQNN